MENRQQIFASSLKAKWKCSIKLVVVQFNRSGIGQHIKQKIKAAMQIGMRHEHRHLDNGTSLNELLDMIKELE